MVVRTSFRAVLYPLLLYVVSGGIGGYFVWHAINGDRGLKADEAYEAQLASLRDELGGLQRERASWRRKIDLLNGEGIDRDLLEEEARSLLGRVGKSDLVVFLPPASTR